MHTIGREIVILPLLTVRDDWRAGGLKPLNRIANRILIMRFEARILTAGSAAPLDEVYWPRNTANWLRRYGD